MAYPPNTIADGGDSEANTLKKILRVLNEAKTGAGPLAVDSEGAADVTQHVALLGASASQVIPVGAKEWSFAILTGTATVGGIAGVPAGVGDQGSKALAATFTITTAAASSAYVRWATS